MRVVRFVLALLLGLGLLAWGATVLVQRTTRAWFERDISLRARLATATARETLASRWSVGKQRELRAALVDFTHDERIMGAAACAPDFQLLAATPDFPEPFRCDRLKPRLPATDHADDDLSDAASEAAAGPESVWESVERLPGGTVHVSAIPMQIEDRPLGLLVLVHDLSFVERRDALTRRFMLLAFGILSAAAAGVTLVAARLSWRSWSDELRRFLRTGQEPPEFQPLMRDVRELVERIVREREAEGEGGAWTPQRLKSALSHNLHGERVVIVANREPYVHERGPEGRLEVLHPASGLVTALEPVMRACSGTWIAHGSGNADRETADPKGRLKVPPGEESYTLRRVWLTPEEEQGYYYGFANEGLWPLCHIAHTRPSFRSEDFRQYQVANERFADAIAAEVDNDDPIVLVQDYHFALLPQLVRQRLPRATVIMFWHIPWPNAERFDICPWSQEILNGMLGASILGFHTQFHCNNFLDSADRLLENRIDREQNAIVQQGRRTLVKPYPISIEWPVGWLAGAPSVAECRASVRQELGLPADALVGVGVDRLDYTKGVEERLLAVERLLERFPGLRGRFSFVQLAAPSRTAIERYMQLNESVEALAARVNARFGAPGYQPVRLLRRHHEPPTVFRFYRAADVCYVSSLHDGMNLVAKEFVAAREDEQGVLVLSRFTGAARELTEALVVNPYDLDEASAALAAALGMSPDEQRTRMRAMRMFVAEFNVYRWAGRMLVDAARLRRHERLTGRLSDHLASAVASVR
jgi:trehalose 6-phosphate synthase